MAVDEAYEEQFNWLSTNLKSFNYHHLVPAPTIIFIYVSSNVSRVEQHLNRCPLTRCMTKLAWL